MATEYTLEREAVRLTALLGRAESIRAALALGGLCPRKTQVGWISVMGGVPRFAVDRDEKGCFMWLAQWFFLCGGREFESRTWPKSSKLRDSLLMNCVVSATVLGLT